MTRMPSSGSRTNAPGVRRLSWSGATRATHTTSSGEDREHHPDARSHGSALGAGACAAAGSGRRRRRCGWARRAGGPTATRRRGRTTRRAARARRARTACVQRQRQDVCSRDRQHDPLRRGDDLAPVARRQRLAHPRQQPPGDEERVARRADREHPRAGRAGDVHAEDDDQERVDLAVEAARPAASPSRCAARSIRRPRPARARRP